MYPPPRNTQPAAVALWGCGLLIIGALGSVALTVASCMLMVR